MRTPLASVRAAKYFPPVSRIDAAYGDRHLVCSCEPLESYSSRLAGLSYGAPMADTTTPGFGDLLALFGGVNPLAGICKSVAQFQRGVTQFLDSVERFNDTMEQLNLVARRVNSLLDTVEEPMMALVPQITRTIKTADMLVEQLSGPVERFAPDPQPFRRHLRQSDSHRLAHGARRVRRHPR